MRLGALLAPMAAETDVARALADTCRELEGEGFDSIWTAQAIGRGFMFTDPFIALTIAATVTDAVELGTAVVQVPLYNAVDLAHRVFSLAQLAPERLLLGVGAGSTETDFRAYGREFGQRFGRFRDSVADLRTLLATGRLGDVDLSPWRATLGGPPLLLGSWGKGVVNAARDYDGWIASATYREVDEIVVALDRFRDAGGTRAIVSTFQVRPGSDLGEVRERLARFDDAGFDDVVVMMLAGAPSPREIRALV